MTEVSRRYRLVVDEQVAADLIRVQGEDVPAYDELQVFFEDLMGDESWCACIADPHYCDDQIENIKPFWRLQNEKKNVYRLKFVDVANWRVITAADHLAKKIGLLAIMRRDQNYESDPEFIERIRKSYEALEFSALPR
jgi:hypothetical protein